MCVSNPGNWSGHLEYHLSGGIQGNQLYPSANAVFSALPCSTLIDKLMEFRLDKWTENWLNCVAHRVVTNAMKSGSRPVSSGLSILAVDTGASAV